MTTEYQNEYDQDRIAALLPYRVGKGEWTREAIEANVNINFCMAYGPDFSEKTAAHVTVDPVWYYEDLLTQLKAMPNVRFSNIRDALEKPPSDNEILITIRHDVDGDLNAAKQQADIENSLSIESSFYLLHTAPYYSLMEDGVFMRNEASISDYLYLQSLGHEIGLHTDAMTLYQSHNIDGAEAVQTELQWLRNNGCVINGSVAHNSFGVYGCNNYSIFKNRPLALNTHGGPKGVIHNGNWSPLQMLDEQEMGLEYEANELFWQSQTPVFYACLMTQNNWYMAANQYGNLCSEIKDARKPVQEKHGTHYDLLDNIAALKGPTYVVLAIHPMHYGLRHGNDQSPWHARSATDASVNGFRRWAEGGPEGTVAGCAITCLNEFGTPDRGLNCYNTADYRIAVFGQRNIATHTVSADSKYSQVMARLIRGPFKKPHATAISCASEIGDLHRYRVALKTVNDISTPDMILIALISDLEKCDDLICWANELVASGNNVLCLLECGVGEVGNEIEHVALQIKARLNCDLVNPYSRIASYDGSAPLHWHGSDIWTPQAHAIVGRLLADAVIG